ncbi:MAG: sulfite exporter TauE/SafE family protein, partial [Verrucomicrobia bacterium]|nr:sulfite exporter TauE/SafE family protein [Deltaproteobacteria bacterium]
TGFLKVFFVCFLYYVAVQMLLDLRPKASRQLPGRVGLSGVGLFIGGISSLVGIGGGTMSVPFLQWCNVSFRHAIGTSAAIGFPIALSGAAGYIVNGWNVQGIPGPSLGFVYLPALAGVAAASFLTAPLGAKLAHTIPVPKVKKIFAILLVLTGTKMLIGLM